MDEKDIKSLTKNHLKSEIQKLFKEKKILPEDENELLNKDKIIEKLVENSIKSIMLLVKINDKSGLNIEERKKV